MPEPSVRMTEMEMGHFAGAGRVANASKQAASESALADAFAGYVEIARQLAPGGRWLDVGCGTGTLLKLAEDAGYNSEGIELTADRRTLCENAGHIVHDQPVENLAFPDERFNVISLINVFSHLTDPRATLEELRRICAKDGIILIATGRIGDGVRKHHVARWNLGDHLYFLGHQTMEEYCATVGLTVRSHTYTSLIDELSTRARLRTTGSSVYRDRVKRTIDRTPGAYQIFRKVQQWRHRRNPIESVTYALTVAAT